MLCNQSHMARTESLAADGYGLHLGNLVWCQSLTPRKQYEHSIHLQISKGKAEIDLIIMQIAAVFWVPFMMHSQSQQQISGLTVNELLLHCH